MTTNKDENGLLPCPFCGGDLPLASLHTDFHRHTSWRVNCFYCGALGSGASTKTREDAIRRWNTRADKYAPVERIEGLAEAIDVLEAHMADMGDMAVVLVAARAYLALQGGD